MFRAPAKTGATMKAIVKIPHVSWRGGRPRFNPGPKLRKLGFKGEDLRNADGSWMALREVEDWAKTRIAEIAARRAEPRQNARKRPPLAAPKSGYTIEDIFEDLWRSKHFGAKAPATRRDYRNKAAALARVEPGLWSALARDMTPAAAAGLHEKLWEAKGLAMANGVIAVLRLAFSIARKRGAGGLRDNPCKGLGLPTPAARLRCATKEEIEALMRAADAEEPSIGDAIVLALFTGQRQGDVLALTEEGIKDGRVKLRQRKTGAVVSVLALPQLVARLKAIKARNQAAGRVAPTLVAHPRTGRAWNAHVFRHRFAELRAQAAEQCASLADFHFADLRDTAVTWLHRAGCDIPEIASVTGHSEKTVYTILRHYLVIDQSVNDRAMKKLGKWVKKEGLRV
jgi:hypothetical protein